MKQKKENTEKANKNLKSYDKEINTPEFDMHNYGLLDQTNETAENQYSKFNKGKAKGVIDKIVDKKIEAWRNSKNRNSMNGSMYKNNNQENNQNNDFSKYGSNPRDKILQANGLKIINQGGSNQPIIMMPKKNRRITTDTETTFSSMVNTKSDYHKAKNRNFFLENQNRNPNGNNPMMNPMMSMMMMNMINNNGVLNESSSSSSEDDLMMNPHFSMMQMYQQPYYWNVYPPMYVNPNQGNTFDNNIQNENLSNQNSRTLPQIKKDRLKKKKENRYKNGGQMLLPPIKQFNIYNPSSLQKESFQPAKPFGRENGSLFNNVPKAKMNIPPPEKPKPKIKMPPPPFIKELSHNMKLFRRWAWFIVFALAYEEDLRKTIQARRDFYKAYYSEDLSIIKEQTLLAIKSYIAEPLEQAMKDQNFNIDFIEPMLTIEEEQERVDRLVPVLNDLLSKVESLTKKDEEEEEFENPILTSFLSNAFMSNCQPPDKFLTTFEYKRCQFSHTGILKNQSKEKVKMMIGCFVVLRILVNQQQFRPEKYFGPEVTEQGRKNLRAIGAVIYNKFAWQYKALCEPVERDLNFNYIFDPIIPMQTFMAADDNLELSEIEGKYKNFDDEEDIIQSVPTKVMINGFYSKFENQLNLNKKMQAILDNLYMDALWQKKSEEVDKVKQYCEETLYICQVLNGYGKGYENIINKQKEMLIKLTKMYNLEISI